MLLLLLGQLLEHAPSALILRHPCPARVELEAAALGGDGNPQRVPGEQQLGGAAFNRRRPSQRHASQVP